MATKEEIQDKLSDIADAIREKAGGGGLSIDEMPDKIRNLPVKRSLELYSWEELNDLSWIVSLIPQEYEYLIGQTKSLNNIVGFEGYDIPFRLIGINHDNITDSESKAGFTFQCVPNLGSPGLDYIIGKYSFWSNSQIRQSLNDDFFNRLPTELSQFIKTVDKACTGLSVSDVSYTSDKIFLLSNKEFSNVSQRLEGSTYKYWIDHNSDEDLTFYNYSDGYGYSGTLTRSSAWDSYWFLLDRGNFRDVAYNDFSYYFAPCFCI